MGMELVYLGFFSSIFKKIYDSVLQPVIKLLCSLLEKVLNWSFENIFKPMLINIVMPIIRAVMTFYFKILVGVLYDLYAHILDLIDTMQRVFRIFGGVEKVKYNGEEMPLLQAVFQIPQVTRVMWFILGISLVLLFVFALVGVLRSMISMGEDMKRPVVKVMHQTLNGFIKLLIIPFSCIFLMTMSGVVLSSLDNGLSHIMETDGNGKTTIGRTIFVVSTLNAAKRIDYNITGSKRGEVGINDPVRAPYYYDEYNKEKPAGIHSKSYRNRETVEKDFDLMEMDFVVGLGLGIFFMYVFALGSFLFISRIIRAVMLYMTAPFFATTMPLDDGAKFEKWKERFVGELFSGFGLILGMDVYLLVAPLVMNGALTFGDGSVEANYLIRLIFLAGGAWAVMEGGPLIISIISEAASRDMRADTGKFAVLASRTAMPVMALGAGVGKAAWNKVGPGMLLRKTRNATGLSKEAREKKKDNKKNKLLNKADNKGAMKKNRHGGSQSNFMGGLVKVGRDKNGQMNKLKIGFMTFKKDKDKGFRVSKVNLGSAFSLRRTETVDQDGNRTIGGMYCSDLMSGYGGMKRRYDAGTGKVETLSMLGSHYARGEDGSYDLKQRNFLWTSSNYEKDNQGHYHVTSRKGFLSDRTYSLDAETGERTMLTMSSFGGRSLYENTGKLNELGQGSGDNNGGEGGDE